MSISVVRWSAVRWSAIRWSAVLLGTLAFALRVAGKVWLEPLTSGLGEFWSLALAVVEVLVSLGIVLGLFALVCRRVRKPPAAFPPAVFRASGGLLSVTKSPYIAGTQAIVVMYFAGGLVPIVQDGDSARLTGDGSLWIVPLTTIGLFLAVALALLLVNYPRLHLDPEGLTFQRLFGSTRVAWDQIAPGAATVSRARWGGRTDLRIHLTAPRGMDPTIPVGWLPIDPAFLADAIRHYAEHPEDRASIGRGATPVASRP